MEHLLPANPKRAYLHTNLDARRQLPRGVRRYFNHHRSVHYLDHMERRIAHFDMVRYTSSADLRRTNCSEACVPC